MADSALFCDLLEETKDGEWGSDAPGPGRAESYVVRGTDFPAVRQGDFSSVPRRFIEERLLERKRLSAGDVLIETAGGSKGRPTGRTLLVTRDLVEHFNGAVVCASFARFLRADPRKVVPEYLFWCLQEMYQRGDMEQHQVQHTGIARFQYTRFSERTRIALPSKSQQHRIAGVLCPLDERIVVLRRMNQTLEAMAQALFRSWFVDFDPVRAKAEGRQPEGMDAETAATFPSRLVKSELGEIPEGWRLCPLGDLIELDKGVSYKGEFLMDSGAPMVNLKCIRAGGGFNPEGLKGYSGPTKDRHRAVGGEVVIANTDLTQAREVLGAPALLPQTLPATSIFSHHIFGVRRKGDAISSEFLFFLLRTDAYRERSAGFATGTTVLALPRDAVLGHVFPLPPPSAMRAFTQTASALLSRAGYNVSEAQVLAQTRDLLLPKLLSGEIRVRDAEAQLAASA